MARIRFTSLLAEILESGWAGGLGVDVAGVVAWGGSWSWQCREFRNTRAENEVSGARYVLSRSSLKKCS